MAAPFGLRALDRMLEDGLPGELAAPLRVLLGRPAPEAATAVGDAIEERRAEIGRRDETYRVIDQPTPLGTARWAVDEPAAPDDRALSLRWVATTASVPRPWGTFLHGCVDAIGARTVLELGAGVGISGAYLAAGPSVERFVTIEGSPPLARVAASTIETVSDRGRVVEGPFESELPRVLSSLAGEGRPVDLAYVDGHHDEAATLHYVDALRTHLRRGSLVVLDDIRLWDEMWSAWHRVASMPGVGAAIDTGRFAILVWDGGDVRPRRFDLARYTARRHAGPSRASRPGVGI